MKPRHIYEAITFYIVPLQHVIELLTPTCVLRIKCTTNGKGSFSWMMEGPSSSRWDSSFVSSLVSDWGNMKRNHCTMQIKNKQTTWYLSSVWFYKTCSCTHLLDCTIRSFSPEPPAARLLWHFLLHPGFLCCLKRINNETSAILITRITDAT